MVKIFITKDNDKTFLKITGHANYNDGEDIVCAGISALSLTFIQVISDKGLTIESKVKSGNIEVKYNDADYAIEAENFFITGIGMIEEQYPENVKLCIY